MPQHYYQQSSAWNHVNKHTYKKHTGAGIWGALISAIIPHKPKPKPQEEEGEGFFDIFKGQFGKPERGWPTKGRRRKPRNKAKDERNRQRAKANRDFAKEEARRMNKAGKQGAGLWGDAKQMLKDAKRQFMYKHKLSREYWENNPAG